ncbi:MAG: OmpA family protein [Pseudomonadota bacterium]
MKQIAALFVIAGWLVAIWGAINMSGQLVGAIERGAAQRIAIALNAAGENWVGVEADGLRITLSGVAPSIEARDSAFAVTSLAVGASSINDRVSVPDLGRKAPLPEAFLEIGRFGELTTIGGILPASIEQNVIDGLPESLSQGIVRRITRPQPSIQPEQFSQRRETALFLATQLDQGLVRLLPNRFSITASFPNETARQTFESAALAASALHFEVLPDLDLRAPEAPSQAAIFQAIRTAGQLEVTACALPDAEALASINRMIKALGGEPPLACVSTGRFAAAPDGWTAMVVAGLTGLAALDDAALTTEDRILTVQPTSAISDARLNTVRTTIQDEMPSGFVLRLIEAGKESAADTTVANSAEIAPRVTISSDGSVTLAGPRFSQGGETSSSDRAIFTYAQALFGENAVTDARVPSPMSQTSLATSLALLEAAAVLDEGDVTLFDGAVTVTGSATGHGFDIEARLLRALAPVLPSPEALRRDLDIAPWRDEDGTPAEPSAIRCEADIDAVQRRTRITFQPSSAVIDTESGALLDQVAEIMQSCPSARFRIEGHTDSRGSENINLAISTARAESVLDALLARGIFLNRMEARGFGEARPIADNDTETGRAQNRRIEFSAIGGL